MVNHTLNATIDTAVPEMNDPNNPTHKKSIVQASTDWFFGHLDVLILYFVVPQVVSAIVVFSFPLTGKLLELARAVNLLFIFSCWAIEFLASCLASGTQLYLLVVVIKGEDTEETVAELTYATVPGFIMLWVGLCLCELNMNAQDYLSVY